MRFHIEPGQSLHGAFTLPINWWTVIATTDAGSSLGGDHHWLRREFAEKAMRMYRNGDAVHGQGVPRV